MRPKLISKSLPLSNAREEGCEYLIRAIAQVQKTIPNIKLVVIGDGILRSSLESLAGSLLSNYCFLGVKPPEVVK
ncbi:MAG: glycosyltransferase family 4 protein [Okeania sp. SIO2G4]|uniref:hypothetical protein n=1 Tax=unclassified Okeania TaxID=2634635 RepID=UPI0013BB539B|nr:MULTISPECIES: hypothetical protein [unclassified Okeania]NEP03938.1 glycosyltransferase family 4 protein [Okeania sp. SIO4D6]NEP40442.1 glycosyltransferase family 4 protein [Okeania sp. SIO2H7]NEP71400.1 glycosyltransferase family 4 protein [Okeania sp. SIO2G5]NEP92708.1 glycosyltransferase family 4 protein [Okeania sp. SIO2F5]NEQ90093.1 glycosyltransferase family 4 protein [Okeania sp. SIO2G4]